METNELEHFKVLFEEIKTSALQKELALEEALIEKNSGDDVDQTVLERERQLILKLKGRRQFFLKKVDRALDKVKNGNFGECEDCGNEIDSQRLKARPTATMCINCKEEQEGLEKGLAYQKRSHTLGKSIINDGSLALKPILNPKKKMRIVQEDYTI